MKLAICMIGFLFNLMMENDENFAEGSFIEAYMGPFNLA